VFTVANTSNATIDDVMITCSVTSLERACERGTNAAGDCDNEDEYDQPTLQLSAGKPWFHVK